MRALIGLAALIASAQAAAADRPNILWITCEDISPNLGCYGDTYAVTPNLDRFATQSVRYTHAFATIGVCAPARSTIISGMFPPSIGTQHMRCKGRLPENVAGYPNYLREAGYYCTNNVKTDYNLGGVGADGSPPGMWDECSRSASYRNRPAGRPFFSIVNFTSSHESQIRLGEAEYRKRTADFTAGERHNPAHAPIPPYHPDTPEVRKDWARYADMITYMDKQVGRLLAELDADGLTEDTIVFFYSDHGAGMPRSKRWLYDSSTRVPFLIRFPKKYAHLAPAQAGETTDRLISFVDLAPTVLSLAGVKIPAHVQGSAFLGEQAAPPREYVHGFRDRMDERTDMFRMVRDRRYLYIRNYRCDLPYFGTQGVGYGYEMPTMRVWQQLADAGKLTGPQALYFGPDKPAEELYDTDADPHNVRNLAELPEHRAALERLRAEHVRWRKSIVDLGFLPESDLRTRFGDQSPYDAVRQNPSLYPFDRIAATADLANRRDAAALPKLVESLADADPAVRFWAVIGIGSVRGSDTTARLRPALTDSTAAVRIAAAEQLALRGSTADAVPVLVAALDDANEWAVLQAMNALDRIGPAAKPAVGKVKQMMSGKPSEYPGRVGRHMLAKFGDSVPQE